MNAAHQIALSLQPADWLQLLLYFLTLSLMAVGGAIATAPDMHRFLVDGHGWLSEAQFSSSIAIAQAAPGPNVLFIALLGWNLGLNAGEGTGLLAWASPQIFWKAAVVLAEVGRLDVVGDSNINDDRCYRLAAGFESVDKTFIAFDF